MSERDEILSPKEYAHRMRVSSRTVYRAIWRGALQASRIGSQWRIVWSALDNPMGKWHTSPSDRLSRS